MDVFSCAYQFQVYNHIHWVSLSFRRSRSWPLPLPPLPLPPLGWAHSTDSRLLLLRLPPWLWPVQSSAAAEPAPPPAQGFAASAAASASASRSGSLNGLPSPSALASALALAGHLHPSVPAVSQLGQFAKQSGRILLGTPLPLSSEFLQLVVGSGCRGHC